MMQHQFYLLTLLTFWGSTLLINASQRNSFSSHNTNNQPHLKLSHRHHKKYMNHSTMSTLRAFTFKKLGITPTILQSENTDRKTPNFYVPVGIDPYIDFISMFCDSQGAPYSLPHSIKCIRPEEKRLIFIRLFQSIVKISPKVPITYRGEQYYYIALEIPDQERIYMILKDHDYRKNYNNSNHTTSGKKKVYGLEYYTLIKHSNIFNNLILNSLNQLPPFRFLDKRLIEKPDTNKPIYTFTEYPYDKILKITKKNNRRYYANYINLLKGEKSQEYKVVEINRVELSRFVSDITGKLEIIMYLKMKVLLSNEHFSVQHFLFALIDAKYKGYDCYIGENLTGNVKDQYKFKFKYFKFKLMYELGTWFASGKYKKYRRTLSIPKKTTNTTQNLILPHNTLPNFNNSYFPYTIPSPLNSVLYYYVYQVDGNALLLNTTSPIINSGTSYAYPWIYSNFLSHQSTGQNSYYVSGQSVTTATVNPGNIMLTQPNMLPTYFLIAPAAMPQLSISTLSSLNTSMMIEANKENHTSQSPLLVSSFSFPVESSTSSTQNTFPLQSPSASLRSVSLPQTPNSLF